MSDAYLPIKLKNLKEMSKYVPTSLIAENMAMSWRIMKRAISQPQLNEEKYNETLLPKMRKDFKLTKGMSSSKSIAQIRENRESIETVPK